MKRILVLLALSILFCANKPAFACDHPEALGHHWEVPEYLHEIHFQLAAMALIMIAIIGCSVLKRVMRKRGLGQ